MVTMLISARNEQRGCPINPSVLHPFHTLANQLKQTKDERELALAAAKTVLRSSSGLLSMLLTQFRTHFGPGTKVSENTL